MKITIELPKEYDGDIMKLIAKSRRQREKVERQRRGMPPAEVVPDETDEQFVVRSVTNELLFEYVQASSGDVGMQAANKHRESLMEKLNMSRKQQKKSGK
jgi:hypothetical protein